MADKNSVDPDERYQYIGFEVFPKKTPPFWKNDDEKKQFIEQVKQEEGSIFRQSVVYSAVISKPDRIFITLASALMVIAPFLPWFSVKTLYGSETFLGLLGILNLGGFWFYVSKIGGFVIPVSVYLLALLAVASLVVGVWTLMAVYGKSKSEEAYLARLKKALKLNGIPCAIFALILILSFVTQRIPFGEHLGIDKLTGRYSITTLVQLSSIGLWMAFLGMLMNFNKSNEL